MKKQLEVIAKSKDQIIASTFVDLQGEKIPKDILQEFCEYYNNRKSPIYQNHLPEKPSIGYMENFRLERHPDQQDEWVVIADAYFYQEPDDIEIALGGFSWSMTKLMPEYTSKGTCDFGVYLPFPFYNDNDLLEELHQDENVSLGRWYKKGFDPGSFALIVSFVLFVLGPGWNQFFNNVLWPKLKNLGEKAAKLRSKGIARFDFMQAVEINGHNSSIYFIIEVNQSQCFEKTNIEKAFRMVIEYAAKDKKSKDIDYSIVKVHWESSQNEYKIHHIEYCDGSSVNVLG